MSPEAPVVSSLARFTDIPLARIKWNEISGADGYQFQAALDSSFKKGLVKSTEKTKVSFIEYESGKKYYFRVRSYIVRNGQKYYSKWSGIKYYI